MSHETHEPSAFKTWTLVMIMVGWVVFKGWLAFNVIGDLGQPDWDYRPVLDVPGESAHAVFYPYHPLPFGQHILDEQGQEENPKHLYVVPVKGFE